MEVTLILVVMVMVGVQGMEVEVARIEKLPMGEQGEVKVKLINVDRDLLAEESNVTIRANLTNPNIWAVRLLNTSLTFSTRDIKRSLYKSLWYQADIVGINNLSLWRGDDLLYTEPLTVIVKDKLLNDIFTLVMIVLILLNTINMGAQLDLHIIVSVFRKPIGPCVGFFCQFVFMPLFSFLVGWLVTEDNLFRLGLFLLGCCPGGTGSNFWTFLLNGDINLSITMTFVSTVSALGMMPLWIHLMGPLLTQGKLYIPFDQLIFSLCSLLLPSTLGMWIRWKWPKAAKVMEKVIVPFTLLTVAFIFTVGVYINLFAFLLITPLMIGAGFLVAGSGYIVGAFLAWGTGLSLPEITAVAIETSFQNGVIALVILKLSLEEPLGELASLAPLAQMCVTGLPLWALLAIIKIHQRCKRKTDTDQKYSEVPGGDKQTRTS